MVVLVNAVHDLRKYNIYLVPISMIPSKHIIAWLDTDLSMQAPISTHHTPHSFKICIF
jgi:hypothetical protein